MELKLQGDTRICVLGSAEIALPSYLTFLPESEIVPTIQDGHRFWLAIAAGRHPDGNIVMLTGNGDLLEMSAAKCKRCEIPLGPVVPTDHGHTLRVSAEGADFEIDASWFRPRARTLASFAFDR